LCATGFAAPGFVLRATAQTAAPADAAIIRAEIDRIERALPAVADRSAALYLLAQRHARLGDLERASSMLAECLARDEGFEPETAALAPLSSRSEIRRRIDAFRRRRPPVHRARIAFSVQQPDLFPEGLAYDPDRRVFYMSSEYHNKIVKVDADSDHAVLDFVPAGRDRLSPVGGLRVDPDDHSLWAATDSAEFLHFDPEGRLLGRFTASDPGPHILNDLVVRAGEVFLTDTRAHLVYRFDRATRTLAPMAFHRPLFAPNGIALSSNRESLFVADRLGIILVDLATGRTREIDPGRRNTLAGVDGLYWYRNGLVGVQYGTGSFRVMRWHLSRDARRITSSEVLEYRTDLVRFPTTGAIVGDDFYFMANTGIDNLRDDQIVDPTKLEPVHVAVVSLKRVASR
jgi:sugar lactone lactonase YvrE